MIAFVIEISPTWRSQEMWLEYSIFGVLMYLFAILYFTYFYLFVIYPNIINSIIYFLHRRGRIASLHRWLLEEPVFNGEGAGTMYLRIGTLCELTLISSKLLKYCSSFRIHGSRALYN